MKFVRYFIKHFSTDNNELSCSGCYNFVEDEEYISALGQEWHADCFRYI